MQDTQSDLLLVEDHGAVRVLVLNRPEKKNAFSPELALALTDALQAADADGDVRAIVVRGAGDCFSAGADLHLFLALGQGNFEIGQPVEAVCRHVRAVKKPMIAAVHGRAVGMGVTLLPHFDMVYAADDATFTTPFVQLGLVLEFGSSFTLPRLIGRQRANELILSARPIDAATALDWGLVNRVLPRSEWMEGVLELASHVASLPPGAVAAAKELLRQGEEAGFEQASANEDAVLAKRYGSEENVRVVEAFLESRKRKG